MKPKPKREKEQLLAVLDRVLERKYPRSVVLAAERGLPEGGSGLYQLHDYPRLSICLSNTGRYRILRDGAVVTVTLKKGDAIVVSPGCLMKSHSEAKYLAFGLVFSPEATRYLLAKRNPASGGGIHRFLLAHHGPELIDEEIRHYFRVIEKAALREADPRYAVGLVELILLRARDMCRSVAGRSLPSGMFTWKAASEYVNENLHLPIGRKDVAGFLRIHPNHVSRLFARFAGESFSGYLMKARMVRAKVLLQNPVLRIGDIACACGIPDANYFSRCFRKEFGGSPRGSRAAPEG